MDAFKKIDVAAEEDDGSVCARPEDSKHIGVPFFFFMNCWNGVAVNQPCPARFDCAGIKCQNSKTGSKRPLSKYSLG